MRPLTFLGVGEGARRRRFHQLSRRAIAGQGTAHPGNDDEATATWTKNAEPISGRPDGRCALRDIHGVPVPARAPAPGNDGEATATWHQRCAAAGVGPGPRHPRHARAGQGSGPRQRRRGIDDVQTQGRNRRGARDRALPGGRLSIWLTPSRRLAPSHLFGGLRRHKRLGTHLIPSLRPLPAHQDLQRPSKGTS